MKNFKNYFANLESNGEGNENIASFVNALSGESKDDAKTATYDADGVALGADAEDKAVLLHSMKNLGDSLRRTENKIVALVGMGSNPSGVLITNDSFCPHTKQKAPGLESCSSHGCCKGNARRLKHFHAGALVSAIPE